MAAPAAAHEAPAFAPIASASVVSHAAATVLAPPPATVPVDAPAPADVPLPAARLEQALAALDPDVRNMHGIVRAVRLFSAGDGVSEARLQLDPEHLGPVALTVRVEQGAVSAHFRAETPAAQRWIETHQQELRNNLREQGLEVKDVVVTTDPDGRRDRRQEGQPARPARARRTNNGAAEPRFEVLV
jgi:flagellar hook-length control protein FliK